MLKQEIIQVLNNKRLNEKCNNYIFTNVKSSDLNDILGKVNKKCILRDPSIEVFSDIPSCIMENVTIDMSKVKVTDILNYVLNLLRRSKKIDFTNKRDLMIFRGLLRDCNIAIQFILYNVDEISLESQRLINTIFGFNTYFFNINVLTERSDLSTYEMPDGVYLDNREDYQKIRLYN